MLEIPYDRLSPDVLENIIKEFVLREGTDYGTIEYTLEQKISQVKGLLEQGKAFISFDENSGSVSVLTSDLKQ